ncbi:hypothetical protein V5799_007713, partial [Amblyomma americanum]
MQRGGSEKTCDSAAGGARGSPLEKFRLVSVNALRLAARTVELLQEQCAEAAAARSFSKTRAVTDAGASAPVAARRAGPGGEATSAPELTTNDAEQRRRFDSSRRPDIAQFSPHNVSPEVLSSLRALRVADGLLESDSKSLNSLTSTHSRKSSDTSQVSVASGASQQSTALDDDSEDAWVLWGRMVNEWDTYIKKKNAYVKEQVRKGIPQHFRAIAWQLLCNAPACAAREQYAEYLKASSPCEKVIRRDIARTYPEHEFFRDKDGPGQEGLFNVMKAYSLHDREVGYCQGSAFIVGLLLLQ